MNRRQIGHYFNIKTNATASSSVGGGNSKSGNGSQVRGGSNPRQIGFLVDCTVDCKVPVREEETVLLYCGITGPLGSTRTHVVALVIDSKSQVRLN